MLKRGVEAIGKIGRGRLEGGTVMVERQYLNTSYGMFFKKTNIRVMFAHIPKMTVILDVIDNN